MADPNINPFTSPNINPFAPWTLVAQFLSAIGTITVAVVAIWGGWIKGKLVPPKLRLVSHNARGTVTQVVGGPRAIFYHLKLWNDRAWSPAHNCRVILKQIHRRGPDQRFNPVPLAVPVQFVWAPAEITPTLVNVGREQVLDFGAVLEGA